MGSEVHATIRQEGRVKQPFSRWLDTVGDGSGVKVANGDYSGSVQKFSLIPGQGEIFRVARMIVTIQDSTFAAAKYGNMTALTNGVRLVSSVEGEEVIDAMDGIPVKTNAGWGAMCYDASVKAWGVGDEFLLVRWTFERTGSIIRLVGNKDESLDVILNDDFSALADHRFLVQGYIE